MASRNTLQTKLTITHISTACSIIDVCGIKLLTDPALDDGPTTYDQPIGPDATTSLHKSEPAAMHLENLPHIDGILLSHEDHLDNLDHSGRQLLDGRKVLTTMDGAKNLAPRPDIRGMKPWESIDIKFGGELFHVTATPCLHAPPGECIGFILEHESFGSTDGLPNVIYFAGDTVYIDELKQIKDKWHVSVALLNLGDARAPPEFGDVQVTMDGKQAARLVKDIGADVLVPQHFESWKHFTQNGIALKKQFEDEGVAEKVCWLLPSGTPKVIE